MIVTRLRRLVNDLQAARARIMPNSLSNFNQGIDLGFEENLEK